MTDGANPLLNHRERDPGRSSVPCSFPSVVCCSACSSLFVVMSFFSKISAFVFQELQMYDVYPLVCDVFHSHSDIPSLIFNAGFPLVCDLGCFLSRSRSSAALSCGVLCFIALTYDEK